MMLQYIKDLSEKLNNTSNAQGIIRILEEFFSPCDVDKISIFVFDETTSTLRDFSRSWMCIDECLEKEEDVLGNTSGSRSSISHDVSTGSKLCGRKEQHKKQPKQALGKETIAKSSGINTPGQEKDKKN